MIKDLKAIILLLIAMLIIAVVVSMAGCTRTVSKAVETHDTVFVEKVLTDTNIVYTSSTDTLYILRKDTLRVSDVRRDSVVVRDSVFVREKGDSVYVYKERWRERLVLSHDTIERAKTDTVVRMKTDTVTVYRFVERNDSAYHSIDANKKVVKERRTFAWLKLLAGALLIFAGISIWVKSRK